MKIALDAPGGDFGLAPNLDGAVWAVRELGCEVALAGPLAELRKALAERGVAKDDKRFELIDAPDTVGMDEDPVRGCREKPRSSIMAAADCVARGKAQALVSAGNSGATMVAALWQLKRLPGVLRPAIACPIPTAKGTSVLIDAGANSDSKPWHLVQFATMGALYAQKVFGIEHPTIGILSNGEEEAKGNAVVQEAIPFLKHSGLRFKGPIEGRDVPTGEVDVIVCDGFVGNVCLKLYEGMASTIFGELKAEVEKGLLTKLGGLLIRPAARRLKARMSYEEYGGAPLLGVGGTVIICHGRSTARAIFNAHRVAKELVDSRANERLREALDRLRVSLDTAGVAGAVQA